MQNPETSLKLTTETYITPNTKYYIIPTTTPTTPSTSPSSFTFKTILSSFTEESFLQEYNTYLSSLPHSSTKPIIIPSILLTKLTQCIWNNALSYSSSHSFSYTSPNLQVNKTHSIQLNPIILTQPLRKDNVDRINYVVQKTIIKRTQHNRRIKETYDVEYDEPTSNSSRIKDYECNWNMLNQIEKKSYIQLTPNDSDRVVNKCKWIELWKQQMCLYHCNSFDVYGHDKMNVNVCGNVSQWIYNKNVFICRYQDNYFEKHYQLMSESEISENESDNNNNNNNKKQSRNKNNKDTVGTFTNIYHNIPLNFTITGKSHIKKYKISSNQNTFTILNTSPSPLYQHVTNPTTQQQQQYTTASTNTNDYLLTLYTVSKWNTQNYPSQATHFNMYSVPHYKFPLTKTIITASNSSSSNNTLQFLIQHINQYKFPITKTLIDTHNYHTSSTYTITAQHKPTWNTCNQIHNYATDFFVLAPIKHVIPYDDQPIRTLLIQISNQFELTPSEEYLMQKELRNVREQCLKSQEEIDKMKRDLMSALNNNSPSKDSGINSYQQNASRSKNAKNAKQIKKKELNKSGNMTGSSINIHEHSIGGGNNTGNNSKIDTIRTNNQSALNTSNMTAKESKRKINNMNNNSSVYAGQSFDFNIYTRGLGVQSIKTTLPKETSNK